MDSLLHNSSRPTTPSTPSPAERRRFQSESPLVDHSLTKYRTFSTTRHSPVESSAAPSPESSQLLPPQEYVLSDVSPFQAHSPLSTLGPLAHLSLVQSQRNALRSELRTRNTANASQKESISFLRKLALRLAVRASIKETHIERDVQTIGQLRMSEYLRSREYAAAAEQLDKSITLHEHVMNELVDLARKPGQETSSSNVVHQIRSCPALPFAPLSPPPSPLYGLKPSVQIDELVEGEASATSRAFPPQYNLLKAEQDSQAILHACRSRYEDLEREISGARTREAFMRHSTLSLQDTVEYQNRKLGDLESRKSKLQQELDRVSSKLECSQSSESKLKAAIGAKAAELDVLTKHMEESKAEIASSSRSKSLMGEELQETQMKLTDTILACNKMSASIIEKAQEISRLEKKNLESEAKHQGLEEIRKSLEEEASRNRFLIETLQTENTEIELELHQTRSLLDTAKRSHHEIQVELESKRNKMEKLEAEICRMTKLEKVVLSHEEKIRASSTRTDELERSKASLDELLREAVAKRNSFEIELATIRASHSDLQAKTLDAHKTILTLDEEIFVLHQAKLKVEGKLEDAETQLRAKAIAEEQLRTELKASQDDNERLQEQLSITQSHLANARKSEGFLKSEGDGLKAALGELKGSEQRLTSQVALISSKEIQLELLQQTAVETHLKLEQKLSALQSELTASRVSESEIRQELGDSQSLVSEYQENLRAATIKMEESMKINEVLEKKLQACEDAKSLIEDEIRSIKITLHEIIRTKKVLGEQLEASESANYCLTQDLSSTRHNLKEVVQSKEELNEQLVTSQSSHIRVAEELSAMTINLDHKVASENQLLEQIRGLEASRVIIENKLRIAQSHNENESTLHLEGLQQLRDLTSSKTSVDEELVSVRRMLQEAKASKQTVEVQFSDLSIAKREWESNLAELQSRLNKVESSERQLCIQLEIAREDKAAMELTFKGQLQDSDEAIRRLQQELQSSQERLTSAEASAAEVQAQLEAAIVKMGDMESEFHTQLHTSNETIQRVAHDLAATQSKLRSSKATETTLRARFKASQQGNADVEKGFKDQLRGLEDVAERLRHELRGTDARLTSTEKLSQGLEIDLQILRSTKSETEKELRDEIAKLTCAKTNLENDIHSIKARLSTTQASETSLLKQLEELSARSDEVEHQLRTYIETTQNTSRITEEDLISKRTRLQMTEQANKDLQAQLHEINAVKFQTERELYNLQHSTHELENNLQTLQDKLSHAESSRITLVTQIQDSESARNKLEQDLTITQQSLDSKTQRTQDLERLLQQARTESEKSTAYANLKIATHQKETATKLAAAEVFQASLLQKSYDELEKSRADQEQLRLFGMEIFGLREASQKLQSKLEAAEAEIRQLKQQLEVQSENKERLPKDQPTTESATQALQQAYETSQFKLSTLEETTAGLQTECSALQLRVREQSDEIEKLRTSPRSQARKHSSSSSRLFSGTIFGHHHEEKPSTPTSTSAATKRHNTLHKKTPVSKMEIRHFSTPEVLKATPTKRFLDRFTVRPRTAPPLSE